MTQKRAVALAQPIEVRFEIALRIELPMLVPVDDDGVPHTDAVTAAAAELARSSILSAVDKLRSDLARQFAAAEEGA